MRCPACNCELDPTAGPCPECGAPIESPSGETGAVDPSFYRTVVETAEEGIWAIDAAAVTTFVNPKMTELLGYPAEEMLGRGLFDFMKKEEVGVAQENLARRRHGVRELHDFEFQHKDGHPVWVSISTNPLTAADGNYAGAVALISDVGVRREIERELAASEAKLRQAVEAAGIGTWQWEVATNEVSWSSTVYQLLGLEESVAPTFSAWQSCVHPEDRAAAEAALRVAVSERRDYEHDYRIVRPDGTVRWSRDRARSIFDDSGKVSAMYGVIIDLTAEHESNETLLRKDAILEAVSVSARQLLRGLDWRGALEEVLPRLGQATGVSRAYLFENTTTPEGQLVTSQRAEWVAPGIEPQLANPELQNAGYAESGFERWRTLFEAGEPVVGRVDELPREERGLLESQDVQSVLAVPIWVGGAWWGWLGFDDCVTGRGWRAAEVEAVSAAADAVAAAIERTETAEALREGEERLLLSQKLEAVGRLAGGVAHDFNNLLTAITGYGELIRDSLGPESELRVDCDELLSAANRAAELTRQLLAFGRRQELEPRSVDVGTAIVSVLGLLDRIIGEDVQVTSNIEPGMAPIFIDPGQLEQVLINLAVNARDAMPDGGQIAITARIRTIESAEPWRVAPGEYVELAVRDTGVGVAPENRERIFEPFFTTKGSGGSGLGLATVYGIVEQSGGDIRVEPNEPQGTVLKLLLPPFRGERAAGPHQEEPGHSTTAKPLAGKKVLLVEDQPEVSNLLQAVLVQQGCLVTVAASVADADEQLPTGPVDILVSDVVLPDGSGRKLAQRLREGWPDLTVLLISGYDEERAGLTQTDVPKDFGYLGKPFTPSALVKKLTSQLATTS